MTEHDVAELRSRFGWNELPRTRVAGPFAIFLRQFSSFLIAILVGAACVALLLGERIDALAIGLVIALNAVLGFVQEWRAETALAALRGLLAPRATVVRDGTESVIPARELVPGDVIVLRTGDSVPADAQLLESVGLRVDESVLTGESVPVDKDMTTSKLFTGTSVVSGHAEAEVLAIGAETEFGQVAALTGAVGTKTTHLQRQLGYLARQLGAAALLIAAGLAGLGIILGRDVPEMLMTSLSLAVAIVPEGLPAVVTITLALGTAAMARRNALVRRLQAVETLGAASVICTDKTGTLTENKMTATRLWTAARGYDVTGTGYDPAGHIAHGAARVRAQDDAGLHHLLRCALVCNHARIERRGSDWVMIGAPTEGALVTLAYKGWLPQLRDNAIAAELPFTSERKRMSVLFVAPEDGFGESWQLTKGAPEAILAICDRIRTDDRIGELDDGMRVDIRNVYQSMARDGLRVIALAERRMDSQTIDESGMVFLGLVGLIDPPRAEVTPALSLARSAGLRVIMITGDSPFTAEAIARQIGLDAQAVLTGDDLHALTDDELGRVLKGNAVFARTRPADKMRIVSVLQSAGQIVAMTGDGVNDAPALKQADIGVAMGIRGTDVAREASDLVLLDDNFATIIGAISEGRRQFANIRKFVRYLLSSNAGEVVALIVNIAIGGPLIFLATQILWMNLVTDGATAVALGLEKSEPDHMDRPPRKSRDPILGRAGFATVVLFGLYTGLASLWIFSAMMPAGVDTARTTAFTAMVVFEKISVFAFRSLHLPCWRIGWLSNPLLLAALSLTLAAQVAAVYWPPLQLLLHTVPIGPEAWLLIAAFALPLLVVPEVVKSARRGIAHRVMTRD
nr:cation-transporting P-type ATPase [Thalassococcus arenae]